jgi:hypothetical protein
VAPDSRLESDAFEERLATSGYRSAATMSAGTDSKSTVAAEPRRSSPSKVRFVSFWGPRLGDEAAALRWSWAIRLNWAYGLNLASPPCIFVGAWAHVPALIPIGVVIYLAQGALIVLAATRLRASNRAASSALGVRIGRGGITGPPRSDAGYEAWCRKHGLRPDSARQDRND